MSMAAMHTQRDWGPHRALWQPSGAVAVLGCPGMAGSQLTGGRSPWPRITAGQRHIPVTERGQVSAMSDAKSPGRLMVESILAEMAEVGVVPDAKEEVLLDLARKLADRLADLEQVVARDGLMLTSPSGLLRVHPAAVEHRQLAANLARVLANVVIGDSTAGKDPRKVKAAATRWRSHNLARGA